MIYNKIHGEYSLRLDRCNQKCLFCMEKDNLKKNKKIAYRQVRDVIVKAKEERRTSIDFYGGEPTVFPFLRKAIVFSQKSGLNVNLATNGVLFSSREFTDSFFSDIDKEKISIRVSLHSHRPEIHDMITGVKGSHQKTVRGLKNMLRHTDNLSVTVVITSINYMDLSRIAVFAHNLGMTGIKFSGLEYQGELMNNRWLIVESQKYHKHLMKAVKVADGLGFASVKFEKIPGSFFQKCESGIFEKKKIGEGKGKKPKNRVPGVRNLLVYWDSQKREDNRHIDLKTTRFGNINSTGKINDDRSLILAKNHPKFKSCLEKRVERLVSILVEKFGWVTYSSCDGHHYPQSEKHSTCRYVGMIPRNKAELKTIRKIIGDTCDKVNRKIKKTPAFMSLENVDIESGDRQYKAADLIFRKKESSSWKEYFREIDAVYDIFSDYLDKFGEKRRAKN